MNDQLRHARIQRAFERPVSRVVNGDVRLGLPSVEGGYRCVVADPPWRFNDRGSRIAPRYETMRVQEICALPVAEVAIDGHAYVWTPSAMLDEGLEVVRAWGYRPVTTMVWCKTSDRTGRLQIGFGHYVRSSHELVILGVRGRAPVLDRSVPSVFFAARTTHSRKPDVFFSLVERLSPGPRLEIFARSPRAGWIVVGDQILSAG
jgi:N6-adenosine-specific RNA methylase IME4